MACTSPAAVQVAEVAAVKPAAACQLAQNVAKAVAGTCCVHLTNYGALADAKAAAAEHLCVNVLHRDDRVHQHDENPRRQETPNGHQTAQSGETCGTLVYSGSIETVPYLRYHTVDK